MAAPFSKRILDYFDLRSPLPDRLSQPGAPDTPPEVSLPVAAQPTAPTPAAGPALIRLGNSVVLYTRDLWPLLVYAANVVGIVAKQWYDVYQRTQVSELHASTFILAVVISAVTYPATYHNLQVESKPSLQLFLALQNGFFWQTVLGTVMR